VEASNIPDIFQMITEWCWSNSNKQQTQQTQRPQTRSNETENTPLGLFTHLQNTC
jgi:hypothetical protein